MPSKSTTSSASSAHAAPLRTKGNAMKKANRRHQEPSRRSLREMPEINFAKGRVRRNPYAKRIAAEGITLQVGRGRPKTGKEVGPTVPRSVRFPERVWKQ